MGKGSSKGHTPREAKDNLKSTQLLSVIDAISEGPVEGPVDGLKSVLLNSTPVLDSEGNTNISGVTVVFRAGEQEQTPPEGFESSGSETVLGTEVKYDTPITRTITSANIDRLRFTFGVQALVETTSKGDRNPSEVRLLVQIQRNGGWVTEKDITIKGKTTSQYLASVVVGNLPPRPFNIRMRRMTPDSTTDQLQNKTLWSSYTEIIDVKQCYPNTALVGVQVDSEQFGSQQVSRNYHFRGRILQVPSNYNPQTRQYSGIWDGTLKPAYSNNMAWCLWDMLTHPRYGMGKRLGAADVDKWSNGRLGYVHIESMDDGSFRTVYSDILGKYNNREGIVIDTRFNGGGRLHEDIEVLFSGQKYLTQVIRGREACDMPSRRWNKPSIMVQCEADYSKCNTAHRGCINIAQMG